MQYESYINTLQQEAQNATENAIGSDKTDKIVTATTDLINTGLQGMMMYHLISGRLQSGASALSKVINGSKGSEVEDPQNDAEVGDQQTANNEVGDINEVEDSESMLLDQPGINAYGGNISGLLNKYFGSRPTYNTGGTSMSTTEPSTTEPSTEPSTETENTEETEGAEGTEVAEDTTNAVEGLDVAAEASSFIPGAGEAIGVAATLATAGLELYNLFRPRPTPPVPIVASYTMEEP